MKEKIVVPSSTDGGLDDLVSKHFGRCPCFTLVGTVDKDIEGAAVHKNPHFREHIPYAVPAFIATLKADTLITGGIGPKAIEKFDSYRIKVVTGASGTVKKAVDDYFAGRLFERKSCKHEKGGVKE